MRPDDTPSKSFVIPKKAKTYHTQFNSKLEKGCRDWESIAGIIKHNCRITRNAEKFHLDNIWLINNEKLNFLYLEKKQEMRDQNRTPLELKEVYCFNLCESYNIASKLCRFGMRAGNNYQGNYLGDCNGGVYLHRFIDTMKKFGGWMTNDFTGYIIIFKLMKGKVKSVTVHKETDSILEPDPNYDCHMSKFTLSQFQTMKHMDTYFAGRYYIYEYDDNLEVLNVPRQILPYAMVEFTIKSDAPRDFRTSTPVRLTSLQQVMSSSQPTPKAQMEAMIDGVPMNSTKNDTTPTTPVTPKALLPTPSLLRTPEDADKKQVNFEEMVSEKLDNVSALDMPWLAERSRRSSTNNNQPDLKTELLEMQDKNLIWYPIINHHGSHWYTPSITPEALHKVMSCYARKKKEKLHETFVSLKINSRDHYYPCNFLQPIKFDNLGLRQRDILPNNVYSDVKETIEIYNYKCPATYIGKIAARGNFIAKTTLISRGKFLSQIEIALHCNIKLPPIDTVVDITKNMSIKYAQTIYRKIRFATPPVFNVNDRPIRMNNQIIVYGEVRPISDIYDNCSHLQTYLYAKHLIAVSETPTCVMMITPNSPLTREWGITSRKHPMQLHVIVSWKEDYFKSVTSSQFNSTHQRHTAASAT